MSGSEQHRFNPDNAFFVIDSDRLEQTVSSFYGFTFAEDGSIVDNMAGLKGAMPEKDGAYVCIHRDGDRLTVTQDFTGCYGLYLYQKDGYFALSNSFQYLIDDLKQSHTITLNSEYADYMLAADLCASVYGETMVREIVMLDRCAVVTIDIPRKQLEISYEDYEENTIDPASAEGIAVLDKWHKKWVGRIRRIYEQSGNIRTDLSGGFDSRETMALFLSSGINLNDILVFSKEDTLHTHKEDFEIASRIAEHYDFALNSHNNLTRSLNPYTTEEIWSLSFYCKLCFHRQLFFKNGWHRLRQFIFTGNGGENIRDYWHETEEEYIEKALKRCDMYASSPEICERLKQSTRNVITRTFAGLREHFAAVNKPLSGQEMTRILYRETRCRNHFGKGIVEGILANIYSLSPLLDPDLYRLKLVTESCPDRNLLPALIMERYASGLLAFPFDGNRSILPSTIEYAGNLSSRYPCPQITEAAGSGRRNKADSFPDITPDQVPHESPESILKKAFRSQAVKRLFVASYNDATYQIISRDVDNRKYQPLSIAFVVLAIVKLTLDSSLRQAEPFTDFLVRQAALSEKEQTVRSDLPSGSLLRRIGSRVKRIIRKLLK